MKREVVRSAVAVASLTFLLMHAAPASAEVVPDEWEGEEKFWAVNGSVTAGLLLGTALVQLIEQPVLTVPRETGPYGYSGGARRASQALFFVDVALPIVPLGAEMKGSQFSNAMLLYTETLSASVFLSELTRHLVFRPKPLVYDRYYSGDPKNCRRVESGACNSFYSGRASAAFASAVFGSYIVNESGEAEPIVRNAFFGIELGLATLSTHLQVQAGEAFYSDAIVGAAVGTGIAVGNVHLQSRKTDWPDVYWGLGGVGVGTVIGCMLPFFVDRTVHPWLTALTPTPIGDDGLGLSAAGVW